MRAAKEATTILKSHTEKGAAWKFSVRLFKGKFFSALSHQPRVEGHHKGIVQQNVEFSHLSRGFLKIHFNKKLALLIFTCAVIFVKNQLMPRADVFFTHFFLARNELPEIRKSPPRPIYFPRCCCGRDSPNV